MSVKLITPNDLAENLGAYHLVDCSLCADKSFDPAQKHQEAHIAGAHYLNLADLCDKE